MAHVVITIDHDDDDGYNELKHDHTHKHALAQKNSFSPEHRSCSRSRKFQQRIHSKKTKGINHLDHQTSRHRMIASNENRSSQNTYKAKTEIKESNSNGLGWRTT